LPESVFTFHVDIKHLGGEFMNMNILKSTRGKQLLGAIVMASMVTPAVIYADASNPVYAKKKAKTYKKAKKRIARAKPKARQVAVQQQPAPVYTAPEPVYTPPPVEAPPAPVYSAPVEVAAPAPAAPVAKSGGMGGIFVAALAAAAVAGGIILASDSGSSPR
jgi:hypothetical protein